MRDLKSTTIFIIVSLVLHACAIKQTDTTSIKGVKHIANAPLYAIMIPGMLFSVAGGTIGYGVSKSLDTLTGIELYLGEEYLGKQTEDRLDHNASLAKFYTDDSFALYKDKNSTNYALFKSNNDFIKDVNLVHKRWSIAKLEGRPYLHVKQFRLPNDLEKEYIISKFEKDRFGNPIFLGNNIVAKLNQYHSGIFLTKYSDIYLLTNGALTINRATKDNNIPINTQKQLSYFFKQTTQ